MICRAPIIILQFSRALTNRCCLCSKEALKTRQLKFPPSSAVKFFPRPPPLTSRLLGFGLGAVALKSTVFTEAKADALVPQTAPSSPKLKFQWKKLLYLLYLDLWRWLSALAAALAVAYINVQVPLCVGELANLISAMVNQSSDVSLVSASLPIGKIIALYLAQAAGTFLYISLLSNAGERLALRIKYDLYETLIRQDMSFFDSKRTGELIDCMFADVQEFKSSFKQCVSQGIRNLFQISGGIFTLFKISQIMTISVLSVVPIVILVGSLFGSILRKMSKSAQNQSVKIFTISEEVLSNMRTVRSFSNEHYECEKMRKELEESNRLNVNLGYGIGLFQAGTNLFLNGLVLGTLYVGSYCVSNNTLNSGQLVSFLVSAQIIQRSFAQLSLTFGSILKGKEAFKRICYYTSLRPRIPSSGGIRIPYHSFVPSVEFRNVSFAYPTRPSQTVLQELNLSVPPGKTVAVVGASGNGKSTIAQLLERFYDVDKGCIAINDVDIRKLDPRWLRGSVIGFISQEPVLFATTVKENIRFGKPEATDEEIYEAAKQANADEFIRSFPEGYETVVGERGVAVSGGQKQRIAIARALIKKPSILILDEATSALDAESEKVVQETLENACKGKTVLVIAHRLSTVKNADLIAVLNKGVVIEIGTHNELMERRGAYFKMVNQQKLDRSSG